jgi:NADH-quinone oxidoreductase subunit C
MDSERLINNVKGLDARIAAREEFNRPAVDIPCDALVSVMQRLRDEAHLAFDMLCDHTAVDWQAAGRFELVYQLYSTIHRHSLTVCASVPRECPEAPSVSALWAIAEWQEREVFDMFGVLYSGHPDLRRLLLEDDWQGYPLRKDYVDKDMLERPK